MSLRQKALSAALQVRTFEDAQEVVNALLLCESNYKSADNGPPAAAQALTDWKCQFGDACTLTTVQCALPHVAHRYLLASAGDALYVSLMGTKQGRDLFTDFNFWLRPLWEEGVAETGQLLSVHGGFLGRSQQVPAEALYAWARQHGCRLILCGHSLGGAIAVLCALRLLRELGNYDGSNSIRCITFGMPAIGNAALANHVSLRGWHHCFSSFVLPEDIVPRMMSVAGNPASSETALPAAAEVGQQTVGGSAAAVEPSLPADNAEAGEIPPAADHVVVKLPGFLRGWSALQKAALAGARSLQQALPAQPRFVHFGSHRSLKPPTSLLPLVATHEAPLSAIPPKADGSAVWLASHRMPAYRARMLALAGGAVPSERHDDAAAAVRLSDSLAPRLYGVHATAVQPPLQPQPQPQGLAPQQRCLTTAMRRRLPGAFGSGGSSPAGSMRLQFSLHAPGEPAALRSISSVRLQLPGRPPLITHWLLHTGPPPVQPLAAPRSASPAGIPNSSMRQWLLRLLRRGPAAQGSADQAAEELSVLEAELPAAAHALSSAGLSVQVRSDFAVAQLPLQLQHHQLWVLGDSALTISELLGSLAAATADTVRTSKSRSVVEPAAGNSSTPSAHGQPPGSGSRVWARSQAWVGALWPARQSVQVQVPCGLLTIGMQFTDFGTAGGSLGQQCALLSSLVARMTAPSSDDTWWRRALAAVHALRALPAGKRMLQEQRLPDTLLCLVSKPQADLQEVTNACAAAATAGVEVLAAVQPGLMDAFTASISATGNDIYRPVALVPLHSGPAGAAGVQQELYQMMQRVHATCMVPAHKSKL